MNSSKPRIILRSLMISYLLSGIFLLLLSFALYQLRLKESVINGSVFGIYLLACLIGGFLSGHAIRSRRFFWGLLTGFCYFCVLFVVSCALNGTGLPSVSHAASVLACCSASGMAGGMMG